MINIEISKCEKEIQISKSRMKIANEAQHLEKIEINSGVSNFGIGTQVC